MKKMIPVYILLTGILGASVTLGFLLLRKAETIRGELAGIRSEQVKQTTSERPLRGGPALRVEVVNTPTVDILGRVDVDISKPLDVRVTNEPVEVEIVR
jgi:hypothetical protein